MVDQMKWLVKALDEGNWNCKQEGDALIISPKTSFIVAVVCVWTLIGGGFVVPAILIPERQLPSLSLRLTLISLGIASASVGPLILRFVWGEWRLNSSGIQFHYFYRRRTRPLLGWGDVERLRIAGLGWVLRGKNSKVFIPLHELSSDGRRQVDEFLREMLSPHFDLTTKPIPGKKVFQFLVAPSLGIFGIMTCAFGFIGLYLNHSIFHSIIHPILVMWLAGLWLLIVIGLFIAHAIILNLQAKKDNPWRFRRENGVPLFDELAIAEN
jgi:hypothetical protein